MPVPAAARQPDPPGVGWFATPPAQCLLRAEQAAVSPLLAGYHGRIGLYLRGCRSGPDALSGSMVQSVLHADCAHESITGDLRCRADQWPLQRESLDVVYLLHVLEARTPLAALLAQAERVLTPEGALLMVALNPYSPWRLRWAATGLRAAPAGRVRGWLRDAGFEVLQQRGIGPVLPWSQPRTARSGGDPFAAMRAGYALLARKRRPALTPLRAPRTGVPLGAGVPTA